MIFLLCQYFLCYLLTVSRTGQRQVTYYLLVLVVTNELQSSSKKHLDTYKYICKKSGIFVLKLV